MGGGKICGGSSNITVLLQNEKVPCSSQVLESLWITTPSSSTLHGSKSVVNFENVHGRDTTDTPLFFEQLDKEENGDDDFDGCFHPPGKKRRLTANQVQFLEKNFEVENKLEPERKVQLAKEVGLQPRQVAIWFQNRRARFKNKQLEKDYESLKASFDKLEDDYDNLLKKNEDLKNEVLSLKDKLLIKDTGKDNLKVVDAINTSNAEPQKEITDTVTENVANVAMVVCKQEDASSAKSDVFDSDSPHCTDGNHSSLMEPADSSNAFEPDQSDFSQDEDDNLSRSLLQPPFFPKLEDGCYDDPPANSCNFGFSVEDQPFWSWTY